MACIEYFQCVCTLPVLSHLNLKESHTMGYYNAYFVDEETET